MSKLKMNFWCSSKDSVGEATEVVDGTGVGATEPVAMAADALDDVANALSTSTSTNKE